MIVKVILDQTSILLNLHRSQPRLTSGAEVSYAAAALFLLIGLLRRERFENKNLFELDNAVRELWSAGMRLLPSIGFDLSDVWETTDDDLACIAIEVDLDNLSFSSGTETITWSDAVAWHSAALVHSSSAFASDAGFKGLNAFIVLTMATVAIEASMSRDLPWFSSVCRLLRVNLKSLDFACHDMLKTLSPFGAMTRGLCWIEPFGPFKVKLISQYANWSTVDDRRYSAHRLILVLHAFDITVLDETCAALLEEIGESEPGLSCEMSAHEMMAALDRLADLRCHVLWTMEAAQRTPVDVANYLISANAY
jgi:hypothetical protein